VSDGNLFPFNCKNSQRDGAPESQDLQPDLKSFPLAYCPELWRLLQRPGMRSNAGMANSTLPWLGVARFLLKVIRCVVCRVLQEEQ
jgi:hypothetical protein